MLACYKTACTAIEAAVRFDSGARQESGIGEHTPGALTSFCATPCRYSRKEIATALTTTS